MAGITRETEDPEGGKFGREADGSPNGYVEETPAITRVIMAAYSRVKGDFVQQMLDAQQVYLRNGITTIQDGASGYETVQGLAAIAQKKLFKLDVVSYVMTDDCNKTMEEYGT